MTMKNVIPPKATGELGNFYACVGGIWGLCLGFYAAWIEGFIFGVIVWTRTGEGGVANLQSAVSPLIRYFVPSILGCSLGIWWGWRYGLEKELKGAPVMSSEGWTMKFLRSTMLPLFMLALAAVLFTFSALQPTRITATSYPAPSK